MRVLACNLLHLPASAANNLEGSEPHLGDLPTFHPHGPPTSSHLHLETGQYKDNQQPMHSWRLASITTVVTFCGKKTRENNQIQ